MMHQNEELKAQRAELRGRDMTPVKVMVFTYDPTFDHMPDVIVDVDPAGVHTIYHQVSQGSIYSYVESHIHVLGGSNEGIGRAVGQSVAAGDAGEAGGRDVAAATDPGQ